uniref:Uncharacterized protein n=1 Tax=viral metagenome TaxID=1070528 RepID=A0A6C0LQX6_9ZZZZ
MKAGFIQDLAKKYVYYLTFLLNPEERTKSTILTKVEKYKEFTGIFDELPTKLTKGQEFVYNVFKCDDIRLKDLKDLLEDHFKNDIRDFFELLDDRDLEIGDLFLHDNFWLSSPDCVGKECYEHSIDNLNSGKYLCKVYEECNDHECLKYLKIDIRNTIKAKMAKKRIDLYKGITTTSDDVKSFLNMFKNSKECASLDEEQQTAVLENFNKMFSTNDTVEQIVEDVFYKDGKNYNCECYDNSDSDSDEDTADDMLNSFKRTKKTFKKMKGGNKRTKYSNYTHHDYDETHIRKIEREIIEQFKNIDYLGLTTQDILKTSTKNWRDEVFRGGKKQMGGEESIKDINDINTVAIIKKCVFVKAGWFSDEKDCNRYEVVFVDIENIPELRKYVNEYDHGYMNYRPIYSAMNKISNLRTIKGNYFEYWKVYTQQENGKEGEVVGKINSVIKAKINEDSRFSNMDKNAVYDKIIKNNKEVEQWFTAAETQFGTVENIVNPLTAASIEYKGENYKDDTTQPDKHDIIPSSKSKDIQFIILESKCTGVLYSTCKWSIILENETDNDKLIEMYTALYGKNWKFYTRKETEEANSILDAAIKTKIINYYQTKSVNPAVAKPAEQPATADAKPEETAPSGLSDKELADIANRLIEQGKQKEKEICGDVTSYRVHSCNIQPLKKENIDLTEQKTACDSVDDLLGTSVLGKKASVQLKKACEFKSKASNEFKRLMEEAIQLKMPETTTFAEWIWYGTIYQVQKYVNDHVKDNISLDAATRQKYTEWLSTRGKETDNWVDYGKATLERTKKIISKSSLIITDDGRKAAWARGSLLMADTAPWIGTFLLMMVKHPRLLRVVLAALIKIKIRMCNNLKIANGNIAIIAKPKTLAEELDDLLKSINIWALSYVPPAFKYIEVAITLFRAISLGFNTISKTITFGVIDLESWIIWIFGIIILTSKDMAEEMVQSMILYDNVKSIVTLFDFIGCLNTPYCLNISPTRYDLSIELFDPNASYDYTYTGFFKKGNGIDSIFSNKTWVPRTCNTKLTYEEANAEISREKLNRISTQNYVINANNREDYAKKLSSEGLSFSLSEPYVYLNGGDLGKDMGKIRSKCFWCTNKKGQFSYYFMVRNVFEIDEKGNDVVVKKSDKNHTIFHLGFKGSTFDVENVNINYYSGNMAVSQDNKYTLDMNKNDDTNEPDLVSLELGFDTNGKINKLTGLIKQEAIKGYIWGEIKPESKVKCELDVELPILVGQDNIPASVNNFERLIMELAGTNPITCPNGKPSLKKEQVKIAGLKMPLGWYNNADKKLFQNKYKYTLSIEADKIYITHLNYYIWGDMFTSAYQLQRVVSTVTNSKVQLYDYGKDKLTIMMSLLQEKLDKTTSVITDSLLSGVLSPPSTEELDKYQFKKSDVTIAEKPMCEEYFLILHLGEAGNKILKDELFKQMTFEIVQKQNPVSDLGYYDNVVAEREYTTYAAIAFKTKFVTESKNSTESKKSTDTKFEVTEIYYIPTDDFMIHAINSESSDTKLFFNALTNVLKREAEINSEQFKSSIECDLYAVFDFLHYDMHGKIGEKYKITDHEYKHPDDIAPTINALNMLFDNLILSEKANKTYVKKYFPAFSLQQARNKEEYIKSFFHKSDWGKYFQDLVLPHLVKETKSISKHITDSVKNNYASFNNNSQDQQNNSQDQQSLTLWRKLTDVQIKDMSTHDVKEMFEKTYNIWISVNVYYTMLKIHYGIGDYWMTSTNGDDKNTMGSYKFFTSLDEEYTTHNVWSSSTNDSIRDYNGKSIIKKDQMWRSLRTELSKHDVFTSILQKYDNLHFGSIDTLNDIMNKQLKSWSDISKELLKLIDEESYVNVFLTKICGIRLDLKEEKVRLEKYDKIFSNIKKLIDETTNGYTRVLLSTQGTSTNPYQSKGGNKHKNTKRSYENVPHKKSNRYTRRILYQDTHYNTQA